jgi:hypothetical protein
VPTFGLLLRVNETRLPSGTTVKFRLFRDNPTTPVTDHGRHTHWRMHPTVVFRSTNLEVSYENEN